MNTYDYLYTYIKNNILNITIIVHNILYISIYFLLLTVGITISSSVGKALLLTVLSMSVIYFYSYYRTDLHHFELEDRIELNYGSIDSCLDWPRP